MYSCLTRVRCLVRPAVPVRENEQWMLRTKRGSDASEAASSSASRRPARIGYAVACLLGFTPLLGAAPVQAQISGTPPESARLLGTTLTLTFDKGGAGIVKSDAPPLVHGFTVDGLGSGSVHPSAVAIPDGRRVTLELGKGAEPGQTVTVSYDPDMVPKTRNADGSERDNRLRYTDNTLVEAFSGVPVTIGPNAATDLSVSFKGGKTVELSWTFPAQPAGVSVTAVEYYSARAEPGVTEVPDFRPHPNQRLAVGHWKPRPGDVIRSPRDVRHGGFTYYYRVRLVTNFGDVDSVVSWTSDKEDLKPATGLTASNATQTTVDLAWTLPADRPEWVTQIADELYTEVQRWEEDGAWWATVAQLAGDAVAHTVTGLSAGTDYSFRVRFGFNTVPTYSEPVSVTTLAATALTASFHDMPASHDGKTKFSFELRFSENFPGRLRYKVLRDEALQATNGRVTGARRVTQGQNQRWTITVRPRSSDDVTVTLPAAEDCAAAGAICTEAGRKLSNTTSATIAFESGATGNSAPVVSVSDARAVEGETVEFTVSLSAASDEQVTVDYATSGGTAESGTDFTAASGTLTFAANATSQTVRVQTADDSADEENETFTLELSNPSGATLGDAAATGTIEDDDESLPPLTASFRKVPAEHDGTTFTFRVQFSEDAKVTPRVLRETAFDVTGGRVRRAPRVNGRHDLREIHIQPSGSGAVSITLPATTNCDAAGAICTSDGRPLSNSNSATVAGPVGVSVADARVEEGAGAVLAFAVTLSRAATSAFSVDYATSDGSARAGEDYTAASGTLSFQAGESSRTIEVAVLDDAHDEGEETLTLRLSNASSGRLTDDEATGTIENTDLMPAALLARFGRATAEQVVEHIEERMAAPRQRGFRARFAGREFQPGSERDFALGFLSSFAPMGVGPAGAAPMGGAATGGAVPMAMGSHAVGPGAFGAGTADMGGAMSVMGQRPMGGAAALAGYGPAGGVHGGGLFGSMAAGGDLFSNSEMELNRESRGGILSVWSRSSRSYFSGLDDALSLNGDVRTTMVGADYSRGALTVGLSVGRTLGLGGYRGTSGGQMSTSMTGFYPWVGYQVNDRLSVWGVTGYGTGSLNLTPDGASALETGVSMAMSAIGTRGELIASRATGGFALAFKADALWVGAASDLLDGAAGRLNASEAGVTRVRTALEGSRGFTLGGGRLSLTPSVEVGLRRDSGDAETGAGMDVGGGLAFTDTVTGLSLDVRVRTLVVHQAEGFTERGMSLSLGWDPTPSSPLGLTARVAPSWGGQARGGAEALWGGQMAYGMGSHQIYGSGDRVDAELGYGLPVGARFVGTPRVGLTTSPYGQDYRVGYGLGVLERGKVNFELGVDAQRRESAMEGGASNGFMGRATLGW